MLMILLEAAFRSTLMAVAVWAGIRTLRVHPVPAQKLAWVLVLLAAVLMPMVMRAPFLALNRAIQIPLRDLATMEPIDRLTKGLMMSQPLGVRVAGGILMDESLPVRPVAQELMVVPKPSAADRQASLGTVAPASPGRHFGTRLGMRQGSMVRKPVAKSQVLLSHTWLSRTLPKGAALASTDSISTEDSPSVASSGKDSKASMLISGNRLRLLASLGYLAVVLVLLIRTFAASAVAYKLWRRAMPLSTTAWGAGLARPFDDSQTTMRVRVSPDLTSPVTIGSTILLPADFTQWDRDKLQVVLAHEQSHVRQGDFYLQLAAAIHAAIFWFSPLGWWLKRKLSELGEALSDRAGLERASSAASYAQILLEFAALPHKPYAGVAMARSSNLSNRIDRILSEPHARLAFPTGRRSAVLTALLVPAALIAVVACIRVVPSVEAAQAQSSVARTASASNSTSLSVSNSTSESAGQSLSVTKQHSDEDMQTNATGQLEAAGQSGTAMGTETSSGQVTSTSQEQPTDPGTALPSSAPPATPQPPPALAPAASDVEPPPAPEAPEEDGAQTISGSPTHGHSHGFAASYAYGDDGEGSFAILSGRDSDATIHGRHSKEFEDAKRIYHDNFIWFERDGKSYVITDPAIVAQSEAMFKNDPALEGRQRVLDSKMAGLDQEMKQLQPEIERASKPGPEFEEQMAKLNAQLAELQSDKFKHLTEQINKAMKDQSKETNEMVQKLTQEKLEGLGELQEKIGEIQGQLGEIQGKIGERQGAMGEKQGAIGERMGKVGEEMGKIGEQEGRHAEDASRKMKSVIDQAVKDGKAKPVN